MNGKSGTIVNDWAEVPHFATEDEEREFWETHELGPGVLQHFRRVGVHPALDSVPPAASKNISIRVEGDILRRLQVVAARKGMRYQTLLKEFVVERLYEEEKREGIIDG
jgi:predicted DNA binding CopG/RHH family protein